MSSASPELISSAHAVAILRAVAQRPTASRASLKALVDRGLIQAQTVHCRRKLYPADQVRAVAAKLAEVRP